MATSEAEFANQLSRGELDVLGRLPNSSNVTLLARVGPADRPLQSSSTEASGDHTASDGEANGEGASDDGASDEGASDEGGDDATASDERRGRIMGLPELGEGEMFAVYKPEGGEQPLWDFPSGLYRREVAAYRLAEWVGWPVIPCTVLVDGPFGEGSLQRFLDVDQSRHYFELRDDERYDTALRQLCLLDHVMNNTDRKAGHCLGDDGEGALWGIDNGLTFHHEYKLRTVLWDHSGERVDAEFLASLEPLADEVPDELCELLDTLEIDGVRTRTKALLSARRYPSDPTGRRVPWPLI